MPYLPQFSSYRLLCPVHGQLVEVEPEAAPVVNHLEAVGVVVALHVGRNVEGHLRILAAGHLDVVLIVELYPLALVVVAGKEADAARLLVIAGVAGGQGEALGLRLGVDLELGKPAVVVAVLLDGLAETVVYVFFSRICYSHGLPTSSSYRRR